MALFADALYTIVVAHREADVDGDRLDALYSNKMAAPYWYVGA